MQNININNITTLKTVPSSSLPLPSELNRSNIFCFSHTHKFKILTREKLPFVLGENYRGEKALIPFFEVTEAEVQDIEIAMSKYDSDLYPITEKSIHLFKNSTFSTSFNRDDSDYIYESKKLSEMSGTGKEIHKKRNLIKQFLSDGLSRVEKISISNIEDAKKVLAIWSQRSTLPSDEKDHSACLKGLENLSNLNLQGSIIYKDSKPIAISFGEVIGNSFMLHFAKADTAYKGVYQYLFKETAKSVEQQCTYINLEQDLGLPQLRQAKKSYAPDFMIHKYVIKKKNNK